MVDVHDARFREPNPAKPTASDACPSPNGPKQARLMLMMLASGACPNGPKQLRLMLMMLASSACPNCPKTAAADAHDARFECLPGPERSKTAAADAHDARFGCLPELERSKTAAADAHDARFAFLLAPAQTIQNGCA